MDAKINGFTVIVRSIVQFIVILRAVHNHVNPGALRVRAVHNCVILKVIIIRICWVDILAQLTYVVIQTYDISTHTYAHKHAHSKRTDSIRVRIPMPCVHKFMHTHIHTYRRGGKLNAFYNISVRVV